MRKSLLSAFVFLICIIASSAQEDIKIWYDQPTEDWLESTPLGNGRLRAMSDGNHSFKLIKICYTLLVKRLEILE